MKILHTLVTTFALAWSTLSIAADGKILGTPGVSQVEGTGGGGVVPWAMLSGYAAADEIAVSAFATGVELDDFSLGIVGGAINIRDRVELSFARQDLEVKPLATRIQQNIFGAKFRLAGDVVYSRAPQISLGVQHKRLDDSAIPFLLGAADDSGTDVYIAASKLHLGAAFGYNLLWNLTARATRANQAGLLGHGGDDNDSYQLQLEGAAAILVNRHLAVGVDYRTMPDNLSAVPEDRWIDVFIAAFPNKRLNITLAYADLGNIAGIGDQRGVYLSLTGYLR